jgi:hypothetical protein
MLVLAAAAGQVHAKNRTATLHAAAAAAAEDMQACRACHACQY